MSKYSNTVDVIIPVFNNIVLTKECINSILQKLNIYIRALIIHDDCSNNETASTLRELADSHPKIHLIRSEPNIGFAAGVNKATKEAQANHLFIVNSDTKIEDDILLPMLNILEYNNEIAAVNPSGPVFRAKKLKRCVKHEVKSQNIEYIESCNLSGYALLIKKDVFNNANGFNELYGRGYYEDTELSRILINQGYKLAIYQTNKINHVGQSSFKQITPKDKKVNNFAKELIAKNKALYEQRFPLTKEKLSINKVFANYDKFTADQKDKITNIILNGGEVTINSIFTPINLPYAQIKFKRLGLKQFLKTIFK